MILKKDINGNYILEESKEDDAWKMVSLFIQRNFKRMKKDLESMYEYILEDIKLKRFSGEMNTGFYMYETNIKGFSIGYDEDGGYKISTKQFQVVYSSSGKIVIHT